MPHKVNISKEYLQKLVDYINNRNKEKLSKIIKKIHAADIAEIIKNITTKEAKFLYNLISNEEQAAAVLIELDDDIREKLLVDLTPKEIAEDLIENLETDDAADVILELPKQKKEAVLSHIENTQHANNISDLLEYNEDTAGSLMAKELIKVNENWNTIKCLKEMRKQAENIKIVHTIYVVDDQNILLGLMSLRKLLLAEKKTEIKKIINKNIISVQASEKNENVAILMRKYDLVTMPVVDSFGKLIGRITIDDIMDFVKEESEKDYQLASGISEDIESNDSIWNLTKARIPWLIIGMIGGIIGAQIIGLFDLKTNFELAFFIPLIAAMGGNVGVQSAAIVVQGIANKKIKVENISVKLIKELGVGLFNGLVCSIIILCCSLLIGYNLSLCLTVSISLLAVIVFAAVFGAFIPLTLNRYNIDPALATGPFITTINDVFGLFIYFWIGQIIL
ncbi:MAG: magnesium transporter [Bacteroidota bacterium]|nr:magnesium transporter [Bacteroidota bacterium]